MKTYALDKRDLISLVKGITPSYEIMSHPLISAAGDMWGGQGEHWEWKDLDKFDESQLWECYNLCKQSWK